MSLKNIILLKFIGIFLLLIYFSSYAWISFLFLLSEVYAPFKNPVISFELMVMAFGISVIFLCIFWAKGKSFMQILAQDIIILVLSVPMVSAFLDLLHIGINDKGDFLFAIISMLLVSIGLMTLNDWKKLKKLA